MLSHILLVTLSASLWSPVFSGKKVKQRRQYSSLAWFIVLYSARERRKRMLSTSLIHSNVVMFPRLNVIYIVVAERDIPEDSAQGAA